EDIEVDRAWLQYEYRVGPLSYVFWWRMIQLLRPAARVLYSTPHDRLARHYRAGLGSPLRVYHGPMAYKDVEWSGWVGLANGPTSLTISRLILVKLGLLCRAQVIWGSGFVRQRLVSRRG